MAALWTIFRQFKQSIGALGIFALICIAVFLPPASSIGGPCEKVENITWYSLGSLKSCRMKSTVIDSKDFQITSDRDETVEAFDVEGNTKVEYLPTNMGEKFPNLVLLVASDSAIKEINKSNFKGLGKIRKLWLYNNQIEKIDDDTFDQIPTVEGIHLDENKIKKLSGRAFASLSKLTWVDLSRNDCIDEKFGDAEKAKTIAEMPRVVDSRCGFADPKASSSFASCEILVDSKYDGIGLVKACSMSSAVISSPDFLIDSPRDEAFGSYQAYGNKQLEYLPKDLSEKLPNIIILNVRDCSIKEITKKHFDGLSMLQHLWIPDNQIEKIDDDTFDGILAVESMDLQGNKIRILNGRAFAALSKFGKVWLNSNECVNGYFEGPARIAEMRRIVTSACVDKPSNKPSNKPNKACGVPMKATPTIVRGENFDRGDFPWMVALYRKLKNRPEYFCGGSLISDHHVLTAAHCMESLVPRQISAVFGAYDLDNYVEVGRLAQSPSRIFVHDHWNPSTTQFDADIAMLLLPEKIIFSAFVQPICLWETQRPPLASAGIIPGWGQSQNTSNSHETIPTMLQLPIHTNANCFLTHPELARISSNRTFCAGSADGRGPCFGDSGGGFYVHVGNVFYLRGVVSAAWDVNVYGECLLKKYTIYTDVVSFKPWIDEKVQSSAKV